MTEVLSVPREQIALLGSSLAHAISRARTIGKANGDAIESGWPHCFTYQFFALIWGKPDCRLPLIAINTFWEYHSILRFMFRTLISLSVPMRLFLVLLFLPLFLAPSSSLLAWAESGHAIIMMLARERLTPQEQEKLQKLIEQHPNYVKDFTPPVDFPAGIETEKWKIGRIGYWPDIARAYDEYNRPTWHYQLGAALTMGDVSGIDIPKDPGPLPEDATMSTQELYVLQALELCTKHLADKSIPDADRAIALCWVAHLIADLHLPCHSGSLYAESVFPEPDGDRGANRIVIGELRLHGLWDQLLGNLYERGDVNRRVFEIKSTPELTNRFEVAIQVSDPHVWVEESRAIAVQFLYVGEVQQAVRAAIESKVTKLPPVTISEAYGKQAGRIAQVRAVDAAARLAKVLSDSL